MRQSQLKNKKRFLLSIIYKNKLLLLWSTYQHKIMMFQAQFQVSKMNASRAHVFFRKFSTGLALQHKVEHVLCFILENTHTITKLKQ